MSKKRPAPLLILLALLAPLAVAACAEKQDVPLATDEMPETEKPAPAVKTEPGGGAGGGGAM